MLLAMLHSITVRSIKNLKIRQKLGFKKFCIFWPKTCRSRPGRAVGLPLVPARLHGSCRPSAPLHTFSSRARIGPCMVHASRRVGSTDPYKNTVHRWHLPQSSFLDHRTTFCHTPKRLTLPLEAAESALGRSWTSLRSSVGWLR